MMILTCILLALLVVVLGVACYRLYWQVEESEERYRDLSERYRRTTAPSPEVEEDDRAVREYRQVAAEYQAMMAALYDQGEDIIRRRGSYRRDQASGSGHGTEPHQEGESRHE